MASLSAGMKFGALGASALIAALENIAGTAVNGLRDMSDEDSCRVIEGAYLITRSGRCHIAVEGEMLLLAPKGGTVQDVRHLRGAKISARRNEVSIITDLESHTLQLEFGSVEEAASWARGLRNASVGGVDGQQGHQAVIQQHMQPSEQLQRDVAFHTFRGHVGRVS